MRTVFHVSTLEAVRTVVAKVRNLLDDETVEMDAVAVVLDRGDAIAAFHERAEHAEGVPELLAEGVAFKACSNAAEHPVVTVEKLHADVELVFSDVGELTRPQHENYVSVRV